MKCPKCRKGKLKYLKYCHLPKTLGIISRCPRCNHRVTLPAKWSEGETLLTTGMDAYQEMVDICAQQIMILKGEINE